MKRPLYKHKSIGSIESLAASLGFQEERLRKLADSAQDYYSPNKPTIKPNGKLRQTYTVKEPLKHLQKRILQKIINNVDFPDYLQGAIKDKDLPRSYQHDAAMHSGREVVLKEDISDFFSTTKSDLVYELWKYFFKFPHEVSEILMKLTTYNGFIPQGARTSPAIANLIFWDCEPELEFLLRQKDYIYTRYIDDITISFATRIEKKEVQRITTEVYSMFFRHGLKPNRKKRSIQAKDKKIHDLNMDSGRPTIPEPKRNKIRAAVHKLESLSRRGYSWSEIENDFDKVNGMVQLLKKLHPSEFRKYALVLAEIKKQTKLINK